MRVPDEATSVVFWIGDVLSDEVDSAAFAGMPLDLVVGDIQSVYHLPEEAVILVNDVPVSRKDYHLEVGDKVTLILTESRWANAWGSGEKPGLAGALPSSRGTPKPDVNSEATVTGNPVLQFQFDGATWHLKFGAETGHFTKDMHGFRLYETLIKNPDTDLMVLDLEQKAGLGRSITEKGGQGRADAAVDPTGLKKIRERLQELQREIDDTVNEERIAELKQQRQDILTYHDKQVNKHGRPRSIGVLTELEQARVRVHNSLTRARELIAKSMSAFAKYLENTIQWNSPCWSYRPSQNPSVGGSEPPCS